MTARLPSSRMPEGHRTAELRSLAQHRLVAERLDEELLAQARERVQRWLDDGGPVHPVWAQRWRALLARPPGEVAAAICADDEAGRDLRQTSPFAGALTPAERWRIIRAVP